MAYFAWLSRDILIRAFHLETPMMRRVLMLLAMTVAAFPFSGQADGPVVAATHVWIREAPAGMADLAGYLTLQNLSSRTLTLISVTSPDFGSIFIQHSTAKDGELDTQPVTNLAIPAHKVLVFASGGYQLTLTKPVKRLFDGDLVTLTLTFSDHSSLTIMAPVRSDRPQN
jgi:periplasmic copper chaperone A